MSHVRSIIADILSLSDSEYRKLMDILKELESVEAITVPSTTQAASKSRSSTHYWCPRYDKTFPSGRKATVKGHWVRRWQ